MSASGAPAVPISIGMYGRSWARSSSERSESFHVWAKVAKTGLVHSGASLWGRPATHATASIRHMPFSAVSWKPDCSVAGASLFVTIVSTSCG